MELETGSIDGPFPRPPGAPWRKRQVSFAVTVAITAGVALGALPGRLDAEDRTLVPAADADWRERLAAALRSIEAGAVERGVAVLVEALASNDEAVVEVPWRLDAPLGEVRRAMEGQHAAPAGDDAPGDAGAPPRRPLRGGLRPAAAPSAPGRRFLSVRRAARALIEHLPEEAREACRRRLEPAAASLLREWAAHGDPRTLERLATFHPLTSQGAAAAELLADRLLEDGRFRSAYLAYARLAAALAGAEGAGAAAGDAGARRGLLPLDDGSPDALSRVALKLLSAVRRLGEEDLYAAEKERLLAALAGRSGTGREPGAARPAGSLDVVRAIERLEQSIALVPADRREAPLEPSRWGGELPAARLPELPGERLRLSWESYAWFDPSSVLASASRRELQVRHFGHAPFPRASTVDYPFVPLVDGDDLWLSGVYHLYRVDARPGRGSVTAKAPKPDPSRLAALSEYVEASDTTVYAATLWSAELERRAPRAPRPGVPAAASSTAASAGEGEARLERLPGEVLVTQYIADHVQGTQFMSYDVTVEIPIRGLVAFDPRTRRVLWRTRSSDRSGDEPANVARDPRRRAGAFNGIDQFSPIDLGADISYTSPVLVRGGRVYAAGWNEEGFINCLVQALDLRSGETVWEAHVSSSQMEGTLFGETAREPFASFLIERDGIIYCQTNLGAVAALDAGDGEILWLATYDTIPPPATVGPSAQKRALSWSANPPLLAGHLLIVAPRDSDSLYAFDTGAGPSGESAAGRLLWRYDNSDADLRDLIGIHGRRLYFTGPAGVALLDLAAMGPGGELPAGRGPVRRLAGGFVRHSIPARGALSAQGVVCADEQRLWLVDLDLAERRPLAQLLPSRRGEVAGSVRLAGDLVLVTSNNLISAFARAEE